MTLKVLTFCVRWVRGWIPKDGEKEGCVDDMKEPSIPGPTREEVQVGFGIKHGHHVLLCYLKIDSADNYV